MTDEELVTSGPGIYPNTLQKEAPMDFATLMLALIALAERVSEGIKTANEIKKIQDDGGHVPEELIKKAHELRMIAKAVMDATP